MSFGNINSDNEDFENIGKFMSCCKKLVNSSNEFTITKRKKRKNVGYHSDFNSENHYSVIRDFDTIVKQNVHKSVKDQDSFCEEKKLLHSEKSNKCMKSKSNKKRKSSINKISTVNADISSVGVEPNQCSSIRKIKNDDTMPNLIEDFCQSGWESLPTVFEENQLSAVRKRKNTDGDSSDGTISKNKEKDMFQNLRLNEKKLKLEKDKCSKNVLKSFEFDKNKDSFSKGKYNYDRKSKGKVNENKSEVQIFNNTNVLEGKVKSSRKESKMENKWSKNEYCKLLSTNRNNKQQNLLSHHKYKGIEPMQQKGTKKHGSKSGNEANNESNKSTKCLSKKFRNGNLTALVSDALEENDLKTYKKEKSLRFKKNKKHSKELKFNANIELKTEQNFKSNDIYTSTTSACCNHCILDTQHRTSTVKNLEQSSLNFFENSESVSIQEPYVEGIRNENCKENSGFKCTLNRDCKHPNLDGNLVDDCELKSYLEMNTSDNCSYYGDTTSDNCSYYGDTYSKLKINEGISEDSHHAKIDSFSGKEKISTGSIAQNINDFDSCQTTKSIVLDATNDDDGDFNKSFEIESASISDEQVSDQSKSSLLTNLPNYLTALEHDNLCTTQKGDLNLNIGSENEDTKPISKANDQKHDVDFERKFYVFDNPEKKATYALLPESLFSDDIPKLIEAQFFPVPPSEVKSNSKYLLLKLGPSPTSLNDSSHVNICSSTSFNDYEINNNGNKNNEALKKENVEEDSVNLSSKESKRTPLVLDFKNCKYSVVESFERNTDVSHNYKQTKIEDYMNPNVLKEGR